MKSELIAINDLMKEVKGLEPFSTDEMKKVWLTKKVENIYHSEAIDGNSLSLSDTKLIVEDAISVGGKPLEHLFFTQSHGKAYDLIVSIGQSAKELNAYNLKEIMLMVHKKLQIRIDESQSGKFRDCEVMLTGTTYKPPHHEKVEQMIDEAMNIVVIEKSPILKASKIHFYIAQIAPFVYGNGKVARLMGNLVLRHYGYPPCSLHVEIKKEYLNALDKMHLLQDSNHFNEWFIKTYFQQSLGVFENIINICQKEEQFLNKEK